MAWVSQALKSIVADLEDKAYVSLEEADSYLWREELVYREMQVREANGSMNDEEKQVLQLIAEAYSKLNQVVENCAQFYSPVQASLVMDGCVGRPPFMITYHQLEYLVHSQFSVPQISQFFWCICEYNQTTNV